MSNTGSKWAFLSHPRNSQRPKFCCIRTVCFTCMHIVSCVGYTMIDLPDYLWWFNPCGRRFIVLWRVSECSLWWNIPWYHKCQIRWSCSRVYSESIIAEWRAMIIYFKLESQTRVLVIRARNTVEVSIKCFDRTVDMVVNNVWTILPSRFQVLWLWPNDIDPEIIVLWINRYVT